MSFPQPSEVLPQQFPMLLIDEIVGHDEQATTALVKIRLNSPFSDDLGRVEACVALEYMAQTAAAHSGLRALAGGGKARIGYLLGTRKLALECSHFGHGQVLRVTARETWTDGELGSFCCSVVDVQDGRELASCVLSAFSPLQDPREGLARALGDMTGR